MTKWLNIFLFPLFFLACKYTGKLFFGSSPILLFVLDCFLLVFVAFIFFRDRTSSPFSSLSGSMMIKAVLAGCLIGTILSALSSNNPFSFTLPVSFLSLVSICVIGPISEELLFRGIVFGQSKKLLGCLPSVLLSSLLFSAGHQGSLLIILSFFSGILFCMLYLLTRSIVFVILVHIFVNIISFLPFPTWTIYPSSVFLIIILFLGRKNKCQ